MSEARNSVRVWSLQLHVASGGLLFVAVICFYGGFTLTNHGPVFLVVGFAFTRVSRLLSMAFGYHSLLNGTIHAPA
jgi:hypothetical protein